MNKRICLLLILALLSAVLLQTEVLSVAQAPSDVWVDDDFDATTPGWGVTHFAHPQDGVNAVAPGGTVHVYPGTYGSRYFECPWQPNCSPNDNYSPALIVYKDGVTVRAENPDPAQTVIESTHTCWSNAIAVQNSTAGGVTGVSGWAPNAAVIVANNVTIDGFTFHRPYNCAPDIYGCFYNTAGVMIGTHGAGYDTYVGHANGNTVQNCAFSEVWHAVYVWRSSDNLIQNNTVQALGDATQHWAAISIYDGGTDVPPPTSQGNIVRNNTLADKGIAVGAWPGSTDNSETVIEYNACTSIGLTYSNSNGVVIRGNNVSGSSGSGIWTFACALDNTEISANRITACVTGLRLDGLNANSTVTYNTISGNTGKGIRVLAGTGGGIHGNVVCGNATGAVENLTVNAVNAEGNWWGQNAPDPSWFVGVVDYDPWITWNITANPILVPPTGSSTIQVAYNAAAGFTVPDGYAVDWATDKGTVNPSTSTTVAGVAITTLTGDGTPGIATVTVSDQCTTAQTAVTFDNVPTNHQITPSNVSVKVGKPAAFTTSWRDQDGWQDLKDCLWGIGKTSPANSVYLRFDVQSGLLYIRNDDDTAWLGGHAPGSFAVLENSRARVYCRYVTVTHGNKWVAVSWSISFKPVFRGSKNMYLDCSDLQGQSAGRAKKGTVYIF